MKVTGKIAEFWQKRVKGLVTNDPKDEFVSLLWKLHLPEEAIRRPPGNITSGAINGDLLAVKEFIRDGQSIEEKTPGYSSPLHAAATRGNLELVEFFLDCGLPPDRCDYPEFSPITDAALKGHVGVVKRLLQAGIPENQRMAALLKARARKFDTIAKMLDRLPVSTVEFDKALQESLERNKLRHKPKTWLEGDARSVLVKRASELVESPDVRAAIREADDGCMTLVGLAIQTGSVEIVQRVIEVPPPGSLVTRALLEAARRGEKNIVEILLKSGADPRFSDEAGNTALLEACEFGDLEMVDLLLAAGANPKAKTIEGESPLSAAQGPFRNRIRELLKKAGKKS